MGGKRKLPPQKTNLHTFYATAPKKVSMDPQLPTNDPANYNLNRHQLQPIDSPILQASDNANRHSLMDVSDVNTSKPAAVSVSRNVYKRIDSQIPIPKTQCLNVTIHTFHAKSQILSIIVTNKQNLYGQKIKQLFSILETFIKEQFSRPDMMTKWLINPRDLVGKIGHGPGIYLERRVDKTGMIGVYIGMSFTSMADRNNIKKSEFAAIAFTVDDLKELVDEKWVQKIQALRLPGICFDEPSDERAMIRLQLGELFLATSHDCLTKRVGERLLQVPSHRVQQSMADTMVTEEDIAFFREIPDAGAFCLGTWATLPIRVKEDAIQRGDTTAITRLNALPEPPRGGFVTRNRWMTLLGDKFGGFEDAIKVSPREDQIARVVENIQEPLELPLAEIDRDAIYLALNDLQGANYTHYVLPSDDTLAQHAKELLTKKLDELPVHSVIVMEFCMFNALQKYHDEWCEDIFHLKKKRLFSVLDDNPSNTTDPLVCYTRSKSGHRIMITRSFFIAFAENVNLSSRFHSIQSYKVCLDLWLGGGNMTTQQHQRQTEILQSFLMVLQNPFGDNVTTNENDCNYRTARILAMPKGYFGCPGPNSRLLSKALSIGVYENEVLRRDLGANKYGKLLSLHGIVLNNLNISPMDGDDFVCFGIPSFGGTVEEKEECAYRDKKDKIFCIVGKCNDNVQILCGHIVCNYCHQKLARKERSYLSQLQQLSAGEATRLDQLLTYQKKHCMSQSNYDRTRIASSMTLEEVELARQKQRDRDRKPPAKKVTPTHHKYKCKGEMYPAGLVQILQRATERLIYEWNRKVIYYNAVTKLYTCILQMEHTKYQEDFNFKVQDGLVSYNSTAYQEISAQFFESVDKCPRHRSVKGDFVSDPGRRLVTENVAIENVLQWLET